MKVSEITGMQGDQITLQDIFVFVETGVENGKIIGHFSATGHLPQCLKRIQEMNLALPDDIFTPKE